MKFASIIAALAAVLATPAAAQQLERQRYLDREAILDLLRPPSVACPDAQTLDEVEAMRL
jgi:hypothetical protein